MSFELVIVETEATLEELSAAGRPFDIEFEPRTDGDFLAIVWMPRDAEDEVADALSEAGIKAYCYVAPPEVTYDG